MPFDDSFDYKGLCTVECRNCGPQVMHSWHDVFVQYDENAYNRPREWIYVECETCHAASIWDEGRQLYPSPTGGSAPPPHIDMPADVKTDYREAASIAHLSPRGAAALLRVCVQRLCRAAGKLGKHLDDDIAALVADGL